MATLKLKSKPVAPAIGRRPVRGVAAPRRQRTLAQAQEERAQREQEAQARRAPRFEQRGAPHARGTDERRPGARGIDERTPGSRGTDERPPHARSPAHAPSPVAAHAAPRQRPRSARPDDPPPAAAQRASAAVPAPRGTFDAAPVQAAAAGVRVSKLITERGLASRREADDWIAAGWVRVDGQPAQLGQRAGADARIDIDPRAQRQQQQRVTVLLHKPVGYVSGQAEDGHEPAIVLVRPERRSPDDRLPLAFHAGQLRSLVAAGRLDIDSTGLLVLTQDGRIAKLLIGADSTIEKEYLVRVRHLHPGRLPDEQLERLRHGLELDGVALQPAKVSWQNEEQLRFVLREGRKRQIRRMCELVGLEVLALKRVRIGSVVLGALAPGQWRYLRPDERF